MTIEDRGASRLAALSGAACKNDLAPFALRLCFGWMDPCVFY